MSGERLGKRLRQMRGMPPVTFVDKPTVHKYDNESISSYSEDGGGSESSSSSSKKSGKKEKNEGFLGTKAKLLLVLVAGISTAVLVYQKKKPENEEQNPDEVAMAKKWAVSAAGGVAGVTAYLLFYYLK